MSCGCKNKNKEHPPCQNGGKCKCGGKCKNKRKPMMATQQPLPQHQTQGIGERFKWIT